MRWKILPAVLALTLLSAGVRAQETAAQVQPYDIDRNGVLMLVRSSLVALDHANKTGNYTVLRELGAPGFQRNNAAVLAEAFSAHRAEKLDLGGVLVIEPQLTLMPRLENGMLHMAGFFPSVPAQVHFDMLFAPVDRSWKLTGLSLDISEGGPLAPASEAEPVPEPPAKPPEAPRPQVFPLPRPQ